jgi:hypothetical protein
MCARLQLPRPPTLAISMMGAICVVGTKVCGLVTNQLPACRYALNAGSRFLSWEQRAQSSSHVDPH